MESLAELLESYDRWIPAETYDRDQLVEQGIGDELAALLADAGSGELETAGGMRYCLLDPDGIVYWSREVLEKLQPIAQPAGLLTFFIDQGGGTYVFSCSNGVYAMHHQRGFLGHYVDVAAFFEELMRTIAAGGEPFEQETDSEAIERQLRAARMGETTPFEALIAGKADADFVPYDRYARLEEGDLVLHPTLGKGIVTAVKTTMYAQVEFADGKTTLQHKGW